MADNDFIMAVDPGGNKRLVPAHYLDNPSFGFKLPPSERVKEPADTGDEGAQLERVVEPAAPATSTVTEPAAAGGKKEASK